MTLDATRSILDLLLRRNSMSGFEEVFFLFAMALTAIFRDRRTIEFSSRNLWRNNIVRAVTILTHGTLIGAAGDHCLMECMFRYILRVTRLALHRRDPYFVRKVVRIESGMAGRAIEFFVGG